MDFMVVTVCEGEVIPHATSSPQWGRHQAISVAACTASIVGCYPAYPPPADFNSAYNQDWKGAIPQQPVPPGPPPRHVVDPGLRGACAIWLGWSMKC